MEEHSFVSRIKIVVWDACMHRGVFSSLPLQNGGFCGVHRIGVGQRASSSSNERQVRGVKQQQKRGRGKALRGMMKERRMHLREIESMSVSYW
jgi:hypothetical protein